MKILISGASGFVGSALRELLEREGHQVHPLVRHSPKDEREVEWYPSSGKLDRKDLAGFDGVVHLAGENIAGGRWSQERKRRIRDSRVLGTKLLSDRLAEMDHPPEVLVCASAIGWYGNRGDALLEEDSGLGQGFLAEVCKDWEAAAYPAREKGIRVVHPRFGVILSPEGGALKTMLTPFNLGIAGRVGDGSQYMSWITLEDTLGVLRRCLTDERLTGPVNTVAPVPVTNREFTRTLGKVLGRPTLFPLPAFVAKMALGEMADEMLLASVRAVPKKLEEVDYPFRYPELEPALRHLLRKPAR